MEDVQGNEDRGLLAGSAASASGRNQSGKLSALSTALSSPSLHLTDHINYEAFSRIMEDFSEHREASGGGGGDSTTNPLQNAKLATEEFQKVMSDLLGRLPDDPKIVLLCKKIDADGEGLIDADEFCSYLLQQLKERDGLSQLLIAPFGNDPPRFRHNVASREPICRLSQGSNPARFISVSKDGVMATWNSHLFFQQKTSLEAPATTKGGLWVTDFVVMPNCNKMAVAASSRELVFYDMTTQSCKCQYRVHDLPCIPICMDYYSNPESPDSKSFLLYGDVSGSVAILTFHSPRIALFCDTSKTTENEDKPIVVSLGSLSSHSQVMSMQFIPHLHSDWIGQVTYVPHNHTFFSCSSSPTESLIIRDIDHKINNYVFKCRKGVACFDYSRSLDVLITGSLDHTVCLWNPYVPSKPTAVLLGHQSTVLSVVIVSERALVFSFSQDSVLCVWNIHEHTLVQTLNLKFPTTQRLQDFGSKPLAFHPAIQSLTALCNDFIAELRLGGRAGHTGGEGQADATVFISHKHPLCAAVYNKQLHQVVSGCEGGVVNVWDVENGSHVLRLLECHEKNELTAMSLDVSGRRLITGSRAGDIKVWQYTNSTCLNHLKKGGYSEVTGIVHISERGLFLSVGWDRRIITFRDNTDVYDIKPEQSWPDEAHSDDILCVSYSPPHYLATGSFDGSIRVWNTDLERLLIEFQSSSKSKLCALKKLRSKLPEKSDGVNTPQKSCVSFRSSSSRPASRRLAKRELIPSCSEQVPVDQVLLLSRRLQAREKEGAVLVTSEAGVARFWDLSGHKGAIGSFPMTELEDECVFAMKADSNEKYLLAGDTAGFLAVFDIKTYCAASNERGVRIDPYVRWRAHSAEVVSVDSVPHETQSLVLSAAGDGTVRLWSMMGHLVGTFGQEQSWDLKSPATFQHTKTPWGASSIGQNPGILLQNDSSTSHDLAAGGGAGGGGLLEAIPEVEQDQKEASEADKKLQLPAQTELNWPSVSSISSSDLPPLVDKTLGEPYAELINKRMDDRQKRRVHLSEIGIKSGGERAGTVFSPFHSLELSKIEDVDLPKDMSLALNKKKMNVHLAL